MAQSQLQRFLERALAFAHEALESPSAERIARVRDSVALLGRVERLQMTLAEARQIVGLVRQLRSVSAAAEGRLQSLASSAG